MPNEGRVDCGCVRDQHGDPELIGLGCLLLPEHLESGCCVGHHPQALYETVSREVVVGEGPGERDHSSADEAGFLHPGELLFERVLVHDRSCHDGREDREGIDRSCEQGDVPAPLVVRV